MDRELEVIRDEMEQTRSNLADKLGALEEQVRETVSTASETVTSTVEGVKTVVETVSDTVGSVTETFNISKHIDKHPMLSVGVALAAGFALSQLFGGSRQVVVQQAPPPQPPPPPPQPQHFSQPAPAATHSSQPQPQPQESSGGLLGQAASLLPSLDSLLPDVKELGNTVISGLGGLAVGSVMAVVRDLVAKNLPEDWTGELNKLVDQVTRQLGGKPQPVKHEHNGQDSQKLASEKPSSEKPSSEKQGEQKPQDRQEQGRDNRTARNVRQQPSFQG